MDGCVGVMWKVVLMYKSGDDANEQALEAVLYAEMAVQEAVELGGMVRFFGSLKLYDTRAACITTVSILCTFHAWNTMPSCTRA